MKEELQEAKRALSGMMRAYLVDRDVEGTLRFAAEDIYSVGLGQGTAALGREAFQRLIECEIAADPEPYEIREERFEAKAAGTGVTVLYLSLIHIYLIYRQITTFTASRIRQK